MATTHEEAAELEHAFRALEDAVGASRAAVKTAAGDDPLDLAEGHRFVLRLLGAAEELFVERGDPREPSFTRVASPVRKYFGDNPDTIYDSAPVDPRCTYRIRGRRGSPAYLAFCVYGTGGRPGGNRIVANVADRDLAFGPDGSFEVVLSEDEQPGNWIRLEPDARSVVVRQYFLDRSSEEPASYDIVCEGGDVPDELSPRTLARRVGRAARFVETVTSRTLEGAARAAASPNTVSVDSRDGAPEFFGTPDNAYAAGWFRLSPEQALVASVRPPEARYWSVQLWNRYMESIAVARGPVSINSRQAVPEPDGTYRFVVAARDPGHPNWLDTAGHREGYFCFRWLLATAAPTPALELVDLARLAARP
jgi:hypothetical protein